MRTAVRRTKQAGREVVDAQILFPNTIVSFPERKDGDEFWDIVDTMIRNAKKHDEEGR